MGITARNLTQGTEGKQLLLFALPMMGAQVLQVTYSMVDAMVVGNFVSANALGAVSVPGPILWVASSVAAGMGTGSTIIVSQYFGAGRQESVRASAVALIFLCTLIGLAMSLFCVLSSDLLLQGLLQTPSEMLRDARTYLHIYSLCFFFQMLYQVFYGIVRAFGDSRASMLFLLVASLLNVALDLVFVARMELGVAGAAMASVIAQAGAAAAAILYLLTRYPEVLPGLQEICPTPDKLWLVLRLSVPVTLQMVLHAAGFLVLQRMVNSFGPASIEGFAAMGKTEELMHIPVNCMSAALSAFVGQNIGAGQTERAERGFQAALRITLAVTLSLGGVVLLFDTRILGLYNITGEALLRGREHLDMMCLLLPVFTLQQLSNGVLQGAGDVRIPVVSSFTDLTLRLLGTKLLSLTAVSFRSIYLSTPPAWIAACLISFVRFHRGSWKGKASIGFRTN